MTKIIQTESGGHSYRSGYDSLHESIRCGFVARFLVNIDVLIVFEAWGIPSSKRYNMSSKENSPWKESLSSIDALLPIVAEANA